MNIIYLLLLLIISIFRTVVGHHNWYYEDEKVYFPGKTNAAEVNLKRLSNAAANSFISEHNSNRIDEYANNVQLATSRHTTNPILNTIKEISSTIRAPGSQENSSAETSLLKRVVNKIRNTSKESSERSSFSSNTRNVVQNSNGKNKRIPPPSLVDRATTASSPKLRLCEVKYAEFIQRIFPEESDTASDANDSEFNGRILAVPGEYPHMTALDFGSKTGEVDYKCGGSLISEKFVITAAHCTNLTGLLPTKVRIGDLNLLVAESNVEPQIRDIKKIHIHPNYTTNSYYNDIALLELVNEVVLTEFVRPIRLWTQNYIPISTAFAMGYGATEFAKERTNRLTNLNMTIVPNDECNREMPKLPETDRGIITSQICARDYALNRDTCQGDSGGPLQLNIRGRRRKNRLHYQLIGITSYGLYCRSGYPSIFTRVYSYLDWIERIVWRDYFN